MFCNLIFGRPGARRCVRVTRLKFAAAVAFCFFASRSGRAAWPAFRVSAAAPSDRKLIAPSALDARRLLPALLPLAAPRAPAWAGPCPGRLLRFGGPVPAVLYLPCCLCVGASLRLGVGHARCVLKLHLTL